MSPLVVHSGSAALKLSNHQHALTPSSGFIGGPFLSNSGYTHYDPRTGMTYHVQPGQYVTLQDGTVIYGGPLVGTSANPTAPPALDLPTEKREMPVVGYRGWKWATKFRLGLGTRGHLASHAMGPGWRHATETAACASGMPHLSPDPGCGCGLYVIANLDELDTHITIDDSMVVGAVLGWGRVVQHGREGWRAQYARILALLDCKFSDAQLKNTRDAAKEYNVAVMERDGLERYVREWGDPFAEPVTPALTEGRST